MKKFVIAALMLLVLGCSTDYVPSYDEQLKKDLKAIDKYLDENGIVAIKHDSGLRLVIEDAGTGLPPGLLSKLTVRYTGKFLSTGAIFDESNLGPNGQPLPLTGTLGELIEAWQIGFTYLAAGGKATFYVPSGLAYGAAGAPPHIPANANLIFDVELIGYSD